MLNFLNLIRWKNLVIIIFTVFAFKYWIFHSFIKVQGFSLSPSVFSLLNATLLAVSIAILAAAGYVINDVLDVETDRINKPDKMIVTKSITIKNAYIVYGLFTAIGLALGCYLAYQVGLYQLVIFHVLIASLLWLYSTYFKSSILIGNVIVAFLSALVPIIYFCFEAYSYVNEYGIGFLNSYGEVTKEDPLKPLWWFALLLSVFAFIFTVIREIIKDLQDMEGDKKLTGKTLPLALGETKTLTLVKVLLGLTIVGMFYVYYSKVFFSPYNEWLFHSYFYCALVLPSFFLARELFKPVVNYGKAGALVKLILLFGILTTSISYLIV